MAEVSHRGVKYSVTQKVSELRGNHILELIHKAHKISFFVGNNLKKRNRKRYLVCGGSCPLSLGLSLAAQIRKIVCHFTENFIGGRTLSQVASLSKESK